MTDLEIIPDRNDDGVPDRPLAKREWVEQLIQDAGCTDKLAIVGRRGYFHDIGKSRTENDLGLYDDAIFVVSPAEFVGFNANTDPSRGRKGQAVLQPGRWLYCLGPHPWEPPNYPALRQAQAVQIIRVGSVTREVGFFGINHHKGGYGTTGSAGCQTIYPTQWDEYIDLVTQVMRAASVKTIPYILTAYRQAA